MSSLRRPQSRSAPHPLDHTAIAKLLGKLEENPAWMVGVSLALLGSLFGGLGDNLVRRYHRVVAEKGGAASTVDKMTWVAGMFCTIILNTSCTIGSYSFAEANLVMPFGGGMHIIWGILFAQWMNGEKVTSYVVRCCSTIIAGVVTVVVAGSKDRPAYSPAELAAFYESRTFECYVVLTVVVMLLFASVFRLPIARRAARRATKVVGCAGSSVGSEGERVPLADGVNHAQSAPTYSSVEVEEEEAEETGTAFSRSTSSGGSSEGGGGRGSRGANFGSVVPLQVEQFCATVLCGLCGANTNLLAKIGVMYISIFLGGDLSPLEHLHSAFWPTLVGLCIMGPSQLYLLNRALSIGPACVVSPIVNATLGSWGTVACVLYFREWFSFTPTMWVLIPAGMCLTTVGTLMLVQSDEAILNASARRGK